LRKQRKARALRKDSGGHNIDGSTFAAAPFRQTRLMADGNGSWPTGLHLRILQSTT
jgi:hypothetical protein